MSATEDQRNLIADTLQAHGVKTGIRDLKRHCLCGWASADRGPLPHLRHQAEAVLAAERLGFVPEQRDVAEHGDDSKAAGEAL